MRWIDENKERRQENFRRWQLENKDKIREYREKRAFHKTHEITDEELDILYKYSDSSCMYCGMSEEESLKIYNQKLHKDHAINNGSDGIENCVLACKGCNSSKHNKDWDDWFPKSEHYDELAYEAIATWLELWDYSQ